MFAMPGTRRLPHFVVAIAFGAIVIGGCQAGSPTSAPAKSPPSSAPSPPAATATAPGRTPAPTPASLGTITLTDTGCSWEGNPGVAPAGLVTLRARNATGDYGLFIVHRLRTGKSWADGEAAIAAIQQALVTGAEWPPAISDAVGELAAEAGGDDRQNITLTPGTYGIVCSANTSRIGDILTVFLVGPLTLAP